MEMGTRQGWKPRTTTESIRNSISWFIVSKVLHSIGDLDKVRLYAWLALSDLNTLTRRVLSVFHPCNSHYWIEHERRSALDNVPFR